MDQRAWERGWEHRSKVTDRKERMWNRETREAQGRRHQGQQRGRWGGEEDRGGRKEKRNVSGHRVHALGAGREEVGS